MNIHGGNIYDYKNIIFDFSANINPLGIPERFKEALYENIKMFTKYPDIEYKNLKNNINNYLGIYDNSYILVGNGEVELIYLLLENLEFNKLFTIGPTFSEYKKAVINSGIEYNEIYCYNDDFSEINVQMLLDKIQGKSIVILCNPNNPTGYLIDRPTLEVIASRLYEKQCILIIDEAFIEFTDNYPLSSFISKLQKYPNTIVLRAVTKFFGMPGIRLGYAVTYNKDIYQKIREVQQPWNINAAAVIAGNTVFNDKDYISKSQIWIKEERDFIYKGLSLVKGLRVYPSKANFHLLKLMFNDMDAYKLKDALVNYEILIRTPGGFPFLTSRHFRLAVLDRIANTSLLSALYDILGKEIP